MPETISEARDATNFIAAPAREITSEGGSLAHLAESVKNSGDLGAVEEKLLEKAQTLWQLAGACAEWRTSEGQRLDAMAGRIAEEMKESK